MQNGITIKPLSTACGAVIGGVDLSGELSNETFDAIHQAFVEHSVIFFRDQKIEPEQHLALARRFRPIDVNRYFPHVEGWPEIAEVRKEPQDVKNIGGKWHSDHSYDEAPAMGSMLVARITPEVGGDTMFASQYAAYEALSPGMQRMLEGLTAIHSDRIFAPKPGGDAGMTAKFKRENATSNEVEHPVVIRHPESGRKALYVNGDFTIRFKDMSEEDSKPLLDWLFQHCAKPEFTCRFQWAPGSIAFWDNRCVQHLALNDYHGHRRLMHRITIGGTRPVAAAA